MFIFFRKIQELETNKNPRDRHLHRYHPFQVYLILVSLEKENTDLQPFEFVARLLRCSVVIYKGAHDIEV